MQARVLPSGRRRGSADRMRRGIVYVMAKALRPGNVKTRLCPPLVPEQAAGLSLAFAKDTLTSLTRDQALDVRLAVADRGPVERSDEPWGRLEARCRELGVPIEDQGHGDLGARMARLLARGLADGLPTLLVGNDAPDLPPSTVRSALDRLDRVDVALVPARDGGYVLVGARRVVEALFAIDAPWSSERVFAATCRALERSGCVFEILPAWEDVDDAAALGRLAARLEGKGAAAAPTTALLLGLWRREGVRF